jgi:hypothetical protein
MLSTLMCISSFCYLPSVLRLLVCALCSLPSTSIPLPREYRGAQADKFDILSYLIIWLLGKRTERVLHYPCQDEPIITPYSVRVRDDLKGEERGGNGRN